jgi:arylsulfatase A-like enzyme
MRLVCTLVLLTAAPVWAKAPNVLLILSDDLGYADLGCYGAKDLATPHLDKLASQGVRFTRFYSNGPVCTPTRAGLMTGRYQQRVGLEWAIFAGQKEPGLPTSEKTLARWLKDAGYRTGIFGKWHLGYKKEYMPLAHGFDRHVGLLSGNIDFWTKKESNGELDWYLDGKEQFEKGYATDLITDHAIQFITQKSDKPFFVYVPYNAVHWPFQTHDKEDARDKTNWVAGDRKGYAKMVQRMDEGIGRLLKAIDGAGEAKNTIVIFTNDNGGERYSDNGPLFHIKATLWEGGIRVPCIVRYPSKIKAGSVTDQVGISMDLTATILALCGVKPDRKLDGIDLLPTLTAKETTPRTLFWRIDRVNRKHKVAMSGDWKWHNDGGIELLYDLSKDVGERKNLGHLHPEKVAQMRKLYAGWEKEMNSHKPAHIVK